MTSADRAGPLRRVARAVRRLIRPDPQIVRVEKPRPPQLVAMFPGAWYQAGPCEVHLIQYPESMDVGSPPPTLNPMARHAAFAIADYAATVAALKTHGIEVLETNAEVGQMWVRDPDGHIIELIVDRG